MLAYTIYGIISIYMRQICNTYSEVQMKPFYKVREFDTVRDIVDMSGELFGDRPAFEVKKGDDHFFLNYTQYRDKINCLSNALVNDGAGDFRIAVLADNCYEYCITYISVVCSGSCIVPIDKELHHRDVEGILKASESKYIFVDEAHISNIPDSFRDKLKIICFDRKEDKGDGIIPFADYLESGRQYGELYRTVEQDVNKLCVLLFTSGTTGVSKGVMLCQRNFVFEIKAAMGVLKIYPEDCGISILPFHHTFESSIIIFFAPYCGAKVTFCDGFKYVLRNMKDYNPSVFVAVPMVLEIVHKRIIREIKKKKHGELMFIVGKSLCKAASKFHIDLKKVFFKEIQQTFGGNMRMIVCGGAPIDPQIIKDFDAFGIQVVFGYGLTECAPLAIINHDRCRTTDSIGEPLPGVDAKIINKDENGVGEICVRGGMVMLGYFNNPEETAKVMDEDNFFHTGDLGYMDNKGRYHITGRCKNVIVTSNGKNIYPEELEYLLDSEQFVASSMVYGKEDSSGELSVRAQIYPDFEAIKEQYGADFSQEEIEKLMKAAVNNVNSGIPSFKRVMKVTVRDKDFVRTTAQKIKRNAN